ncbi:hypothetical protein [Nonomuraea aridisoli]|uniref:hypothetical protein n=1 Tax=Nonomuraea aridisoli TaxID=2070368 RepID=UPI001C64FB52|nr:hypothetical protein [Nonomuraea aridisoli]
MDQVETAASAAGFDVDAKEKDRKAFLTLTGRGKVICVHYIVRNLATGYRRYGLMAAARAIYRTISRVPRYPAPPANRRANSMQRPLPSTRPRPVRPHRDIGDMTLMTSEPPEPVGLII